MEVKDWGSLATAIAALLTVLVAWLRNRRADRREDTTGLVGNTLEFAEQLRAELADNRARMAAMEVKYAEVLRANDELRRTVAELTSQLEEARGAATHVAYLTAQNSELMAKNALLTAEVESIKRQLRQLQNGGQATPASDA